MVVVVVVEVVVVVAVVVIVVVVVLLLRNLNAMTRAEPAQKNSRETPAKRKRAKPACS